MVKSSPLLSITFCFCLSPLSSVPRVNYPVVFMATKNSIFVALWGWGTFYDARPDRRCVLLKVLSPETAHFILEHISDDS